MTFSPKKRKSELLRGIFREIFVSVDHELTAFGTVFVFPPENIELDSLGTLFGIIKIDDKSSDSSYIVNLLTSVLKKEYFSNPNRLAETSFEASLRKANLALAELARQGSVKWSGKINFAGGVLVKNNLHFSKLGTTAILLLRGEQIADIGAGMGSESEGIESHPLKTFSDISSGKLEKNDCLVFSTGDLLEIFSTEEIRQHASRFSRDEFLKFLSMSLSDNSELAAAIVINLTTEQEIDEKNLYLTIKPIETEKKETELGEEFREIAAANGNNEARSSKRNHLFTSDYEEITSRKKLTGNILLSIGSIFSSMQTGRAEILDKLRKFFAEMNWRSKFSAITSSLSAISNSFGRFGWMREKANLKLIVTIAAIFLVVFSSIIFFRQRNIPSSSPENAIQNIPPPTPLKDKQVKSIENVEEITPLSTESREIAILDGRLYVISSNKSVTQFNPASGETSTFDSDLPVEKFSAITAMPDLKTIFILTAEKKIISFTPINKKFQENSISFPDNLKMVDAKTFLTYLYVLDSTANQIYRYPRAEGGFGERQNWMKSEADIRNSVSFAINEDLFVADRGHINSFYQGKKDEKVTFESPDVPLAIDKIYTDVSFSNIYVLDNKNHRVVVFSSDGKILAQYWNSSISGVKDFTVDEKSNIIYLLKSDSIFKFSMN